MRSLGADVRHAASTVGLEVAIVDQLPDQFSQKRTICAVQRSLLGTLLRSSMLERS
jgi:hypothetical protein